MAETLLQSFLDQYLLKDHILERIWLVSLVMMVVATLLWFLSGKTHPGYRTTAVYWLFCGIAMWMLVTLRPADLTSNQMLPASGLVISAVSLLFVGLPILVNHRQRNRAWPTRLDQLLVRYRPPSSLITSMTVLSLVVFFLAISHITSLTSLAAALMMGLALLLVVDKSFRLEAAFSGMIHISLALACTVLVLSGGSSRSIPTLMNIAIIVLGCLSFHWMWLGGVWQQQVLEGKPLTTAARMIPLTKHAGVMLLGFGSLLLLKLALWRKMPAVHDWDNSLDRLLLLGIAGLLILLVNYCVAVRLSSPILGYLLIFNLAAFNLAYLFRWPWFLNYAVWPYWPNWMTGAGAILLFFAWLARNRDYPFFAKPAALSAIAVCLTTLLLTLGLNLLLPNVYGPGDFGLASAICAVLVLAGWRIQNRSGTSVKHVERQ